MKKPLHVLLALVLAALFVVPAIVPAPAHAADEGEGKTLDIVGHAADGYYVDFSPLAIVELPRILIIEEADGSMDLQVYGSTKAAVESGNFNLRVTEGDNPSLAQTPAEIAAVTETHYGHGYLYAQLVPKGEASLALDLSITRHLIFGLLAMIVVCLIFITLARRYKKGVGRTEAPKGIFQNMFEAMVIYVRDEIAKPTLGDKYQKFLPYLLSAFFFILFANIFGLVPYGAAATSNIAITFILATFTFFIGQIYASKEHWKHILLGPPEAPLLIRIILIPVEILGLLTRHIALAIRLFANMSAGALVIFSLLGLIFTVNVLFGAGAAYGAAVPSILLTVFISVVKLLVAFIQAYVFTMLSGLFIGMAIEEHHHEEGPTPELDQRDHGKVTPAFGSGGDGMAEERTRVTEDRPATVTTS